MKRRQKLAGQSLVKSIGIGQFTKGARVRVYLGSAFELGSGNRENRMRTIIVAVIVAMTASAAMADDIADAHRQALAGRDSYWHCLAQAYARDNNSMSGEDFTLHIASACPSERQNFRVTLVSYLSMQFPNVDAGAHLTTANNAIALAQKDIVTTFIKRKTASHP